MLHRQNRNQVWLKIFRTKLYQRHPLINKRGCLLLFTVFFFCTTRCSSTTGLHVSAVTTSPIGQIVIASDDRKSLQLYHYGIKGLYKNSTDSQYILPSCLITELKYLTDGSLAIITETNGIYIYPPNKTNKKILPLYIDPNHLEDNRIRDVFLFTHNESKKLYVTYKSPFGSGVTICKISENFRGAVFSTLNKQNSQLRSNYVHQIAVDLKGNIWFRYSSIEEEGVSRLSPSGEWDHFNMRNSELGDSGVTLMAIESKDEGLENDNIWFVTAAGLSRLEYKNGKEIWKLYGDKQTFINKIIRFLGLESYFTDAIMGIRDIVILQDSILIANMHAIFHFTGEYINRFVPETVKDIDDCEISHIAYFNNFVHVFIKLPLKQDPSIRSLMILNLKKRIWQRMNYWPILQAYPDNIHLLPLDANNSQVILIYSSGELKSAIYNYPRSELNETPILTP